VKVAVIGPVCKDLNIVKGKAHSQPGGAAYYTGEALACLGVETVVFGTFGNEKAGWLKGFKAGLVHIPAEGTIRFVNEYPDTGTGARIQRAEIYKNEIKIKDIQPSQLAGLDYLILGPLIYHNISRPLVEELSGYSKLILAAQGTIRYLEGERIVWKNPDNVLGMMPFVDYVFLDDNELKFISRRDEISRAARFLQEKGAGKVIVTQGEQGSRIFLEDKDYKITSFPAQEVVDPTGAGDSYLAGFVKALELFDDPSTQGEFAAMTATLSLEREGPFSGTTDSVLDRLGWK